MFHVISRGDKEETIFGEDHLKECFLRYLGIGAERYEIDIYAFCIMNTHYHLLLQLNKTNLVEFMHYLGSSYANYLISCGWKGHVFRGRYKAILVDREAYMLAVVRYIHLNPVEAGIVELPEQYPWSSYAIYLDNSENVSWLKRNWLTSYFGREGIDAVSAFRQFTEEGIGKDDPGYPEKIKAGLVCGRPEFIAQVLSYIDGDDRREAIRKKFGFSSMSLEEINSMVCRAFTLDDLRRGDYRHDQTYRRACDVFLYLAKDFTQSSNAEIGDKLGHASNNVISCRFYRLRQKINDDVAFRDDFLRQVKEVLESGHGKGLTPKSVSDMERD
ncbi:MAG: transposase [Actinobacteria bacterium]|nr:transposase [Actinomycetota bacterium]